MPDKKGKVETAAVTGLLLVLFLGFLLFVFVKNSAIINVDVNAKETCKRSVEQYAKLKLPGIDLTDINHIKCPTRSITINNDDGKKAKAGIAKAMYDCFDQFGAGELELFDTRRASAVNYCVVCSKISFTDKDKEVKGLAEYLATTAIQGKEITYYEFFKGGSATEEETTKVALGSGGSGGAGASKTFEDLSGVDASKPHAVLFTYAKSTGWWDKLSAGAIAGTAGLVIGGAVAGFFTGGMGWVVTAAAVTGGVSTGVAVAKAPGLQSDWQAGILFLPYDDQLKSQLGCSEIPIKQ